MMPMPKIGQHGRPAIENGEITYSYMDSHGNARTVTRPVLAASDIVKIVQKRIDRFSKSNNLARESETSRADRKYISAQPRHRLMQAWKLMNAAQRMEASMMLSHESHHGISDPKWLEAHASAREDIIGDDGKPLC